MPSRRVMLAIYAVIFTVLGVMSVRRVYTLKTDFDGFWRAGRVALHGGDPYAPLPGPGSDRLLFPGLRENASAAAEDADDRTESDSPVRRYLPFFSLFMVPLALLPMDLSCAVWHVISTWALFVAVRHALRLAGRDDRLTSADACFALAGTAVFWVSSMTMGQIGLVTLALCLAAFDLARSRPRVAGALVGLATALKVTPGIVAVYFLLKRRWSAALASAAAFAACGALSIPAWGPSRTVAMHRAWIEESATTAGARFFEARDSFRYANQSLSAWVARVFMDVNAGRSRRPFQVNVASVSPRTASWILRALQLPLVAGFLWLCLARRRDEPLTLEEAGVALAITTFLSPIAWTFHLVFALPALLSLWLRRAEPGSRRWLIAALLLQLGILHPVTRALGAPAASTLAALAGAWRAGMRDRSGCAPVNAG